MQPLATKRSPQEGREMLASKLLLISAERLTNWQYPVCWGHGLFRGCRRVSPKLVVSRLLGSAPQGGKDARVEAAGNPRREAADARVEKAKLEEPKVGRS